MRPSPTESRAFVARDRSAGQPPLRQLTARDHRQLLGLTRRAVPIDAVPSAPDPGLDTLRRWIPLAVPGMAILLAAGTLLILSNL